MRKFAELPVSMLFDRAEWGAAIAYQWNEVVNKGLDPLTPLRVPESRESRILHTTGRGSGNAVTQGFFTGGSGVYALTQKAVDAIEEYFKDLRPC